MVAEVGSRLSLIGSPLFVLSVVVLVVNDHVVKSAWPGTVSGKLSDVAGVAMVAMLLTAATGKRSVGFALTSIGFVGLKTVPVVAAASAPLLGGTTRTDATDLIALVVLMPLWWWIGRASEAPVTAGSRWLLPLQIVAISAAVVATTATSCEGEGVLSVTVVDGVVHATTVTDVFESVDGGATWETSTIPSWDDRLDRPYPESLRDCAESDRCVELVPGSGVGPVDVTVVEVRGDERRAILTVTAEQRQALLNVVAPQCGDGFFDAISVVDREDGEHVVVAMGSAGVLHHRPDQVWEWVAVGEHGLRASQVAAEPFGFDARSTTPTDGWDRWPIGVIALLLVLAPLSVALAIIPIVLLARRHRRDPIAGVITCSVVAAGLAALGLFLFAFVGVFGERGGIAMGSAFVAAIAVFTVAPLLAWYGRPRRPARWEPPDPAGRAG
jgi:hypothetical protein